jgi:hypothetical protein
VISASTYSAKSPGVHWRAIAADTIPDDRRYNFHQIALPRLGNQQIFRRILAIFFYPYDIYMKL